MAEKTPVTVGDYRPLSPETCAVIAEAGANHNNSVETAIEMARQASLAGAWGVKYQLYKADSISVPASPKYWDDPFGSKSQYEAFQMSDKLDYDDYAEVAKACRELGIVFFATPFDLEAIASLERMDTPIYKIASGDLTHKPLIEAVASTGKPILLSTGAATVEEIQDAIDWSGLGPDKLILLACTLAYPTDDEDGHFARIPQFAETFAPYLIGMSDHTLGVAGAWMTAALGGVCIEKHYTLDKTLPDIPDHRISVEPQELKEMVAACDRASILRGDSTIAVRAAEEPARLNARRSIVLERDVAEGASIETADLGFKRPGSGLPPSAADELIGRKAARSLKRGELLSTEDVG